MGAQTARARDHQARPTKKAPGAIAVGCNTRPYRLNHPFVYWLARPYMGEMLEAGVRIFECRDFMVHAKTAAVDGVWSTAGPANLDTLSLFGLHGTNLEIHDGRVARGLEGMFELDKTSAEELTTEKWENRPPSVKLVEWALATLRVFG